MINKIMLSELMKCKALELQESKGPDAALEQVDKTLAAFDTRASEGKTGEDLLGEYKSQGAAVGRLYQYRAELLASSKRFDEALTAIDMAVALSCDRIHISHGIKGDILMELEKDDDAIVAYEAAITARPLFVAAFESLAKAYRSGGKDSKALDIIDKALEIHPKAVLIRDKAFVLSNMKRDDDALSMLDAAIKSPPHEETETLSAFGGSASSSTLLKAKAAILADLQRYEEANKELAIILESDPEEEEAVLMRKDIYITLAREYLGNNEIPQYLDSLVAKVLESKPDAPICMLVIFLIGCSFGRGKKKKKKKKKKNSFYD